MNSSPLRLLLPATLAVVVAFGAGYLVRGPGGSLPVVPLPSGEVPVDPTPTPATALSGIDNDALLEVFVDAAGKIQSEGLTLHERTGTLTLAVNSNYEGVLSIYIERTGVGSADEVVYTARLDRPSSGEASVTIAQAGSYKLTVIPGDPPGAASSAILIVEPALP